MVGYKDLAKVFEERVEGITYYPTRASMKLGSELRSVLESESKQLLFLLGTPGSGKSVFLQQLPNLLEDRFEVVSFRTPFFEPVDFIKTLIQRVGREPGSYALERLLQEAVELYQDKDVIVTIDEAQLLSEEMLELLRILADSKAFWFLLAMHKHEASQVLQKPQFRSRPHRVLELGSLECEEIREFIAKELIKAGAFGLEKEFSNSLIKEICGLAKGNFRDTKKILHRLFLLMDEAMRLGKKSYTRPNRCLVTMAAIDGGLIE
ncbi:MAG: hypothetical protein C6H99_01970 [Epsilonproteobacteria bacterium]|nr:hypothetical protein [Campylobacterota bacterium]NPA63849.1 AAA family ATPase [Campylobacterota bacterium]